MFERFTERARKVMSLARQEAQKSNSEFIGTEHMLLGIVSEGGGVAYSILKMLNIEGRLREEIKKIVTPNENPTVTLGQLPLSPRLKKVIELAVEASFRMKRDPDGKDDVIGTEHLLIGLVLESEGIAYQALKNLGVDPSDVEKTVHEVMGTAPSGLSSSDSVCKHCKGTGREPLDKETTEIYRAICRVVKNESPSFSAKHEGARVLEAIARFVRAKYEAPVKPRHEEEGPAQP